MLAGCGCFRVVLRVLFLIWWKPLEGVVTAVVCWRCNGVECCCVMMNTLLEFAADALMICEVTASGVGGYATCEVTELLASGNFLFFRVFSGSGNFGGGLLSWLSFLALLGAIDPATMGVSSCLLMSEVRKFLAVLQLPCGWVDFLCSADAWLGMFLMQKGAGLQCCFCMKWLMLLLLLEPYTVGFECRWYTAVRLHGGGKAELSMSDGLS
ncbi:hypothetical protein Nepgr_022807 [Nepenthes gracilis]|uniref:Uncharacterized protein n=1 Tax=Nepenthes gracilis TaxID=150966 RepID=A0AAD3T1D3_NEPGR|nr:hypothetical protein Nepgr_022807 [Nepenthes gracilis]